MCLSIVDKIYDPPLAEEREAWGVFTRGGKTVNMFFQAKTGEWVRSSDGTIRGGDICSVERSCYPHGFHKFEERDAAERWVISDEGEVRRVKLRGIVAEGRQDVPGTGCFTLCAVIVAKEMFVYPDEEQTT